MSCGPQRSRTHDEWTRERVGNNLISDSEPRKVISSSGELRTPIGRTRFKACYSLVAFAMNKMKNLLVFARRWHERSSPVPVLWPNFDGPTTGPVLEFLRIEEPGPGTDKTGPKLVKTSPD